MKRQKKLFLISILILSAAAGAIVTVFFFSGSPKTEAWQASDQPFYQSDVGDYYDPGELYWPYDIAVDSSGNIYVTNKDNYRVEKYNSNGNFLTSWGSYGSGNGEFYAPRSVAVDSLDNIYVSDTGNYNIQKFDSSGNYITQWGSYGSGDGQFNNPTFSAGMRIDTDSSNNVYVTDNGNDRVQKFDSNGSHLLNFTDASMTNAFGVTVDSSGNVIVYASGAVYIYNSAGVFQTSFAVAAATGLDIASKTSGNVVIVNQSPAYLYEYTQAGGLVNTYNTSTTYSHATGELSNPRGIDIDSSNNIYIADTANFRYQVFNSSGTYIKKGGSDILGGYDYTYPQDVAFDDNGNYYVADTGLNRVLRYNAAGVNTTIIGADGLSGTGDGQFDFPEGVGTDTAGNAYVADSGNDRVQIFNSSGTFLYKFGTYGTGDGQFNNPSDIAIDEDGYIYVVDNRNHRIQKFDSNRNYVSQWGTLGTGDGQFNRPYYIAIDDVNDYVYVTDSYNDRIEKFTKSGVYVTQFGSSGTGNGEFNFPTGITVDQAGNVFVVDQCNNRVERFDSNGNYITEFSSPFDRGDEEFDYPYGIDYNPNNGELFLVDYNNQKIHKYKYDIIPPSIFPQSAIVNPPSGNTRSISGYVQDAMTNIISVQFRMDDGTWTNCTINDGIANELTEDFTCTYDSALSVGSHTFYIRTTDSRTNTSALFPYSFTVVADSDDGGIDLISIIDDILNENEEEGEEEIEDINTSDEVENEIIYAEGSSEHRSLPERIIDIHNTVAPVTLTAAFVLLGSTALFAYPYSTIYYGFEWFVNLAKKKAYGLVYDAREKDPVPFAIVEVFKGKELIERTVTNNHGKYLLVVDKGDYKIKITQNGYQEYIQDLKIEDDQHSIVDRFGIFKKEDDFSTSVNKTRKALKEFAPQLFWIGFGWSIIALILSFTLLNIIIVAIYLIQIIFLMLNKSPRNWGLVYDIDERWKLPGVFVQAYDPETDQTVDTQITDQNGRFGFVLSGPIYELLINSDQYELAKNNKTVTRGKNKFIKYKTGTNQIDKISLKKKK